MSFAKLIRAYSRSDKRDMSKIDIKELCKHIEGVIDWEKQHTQSATVYLNTSEAKALLDHIKAQEETIKVYKEGRF